MCGPRPWLEELANIAGYMSRAEQNDRKLLQESKGMEICKVSENSVGTKSVYHGLIDPSILGRTGWHPMSRRLEVGFKHSMVCT